MCGKLRVGGNEDYELLAYCTQPPHPRPLSLKGRGGQKKTETLVRENSHRPLPAFLPSPLEGEGPGVRGHFTRDSHGALSTPSPSICRRNCRVPSRPCVGVTPRKVFTVSGGTRSRKNFDLERLDG